ncbi:MAG: S1/P1 nuclease [Verrucomicrobiota bacterium]
MASAWWDGGHKAIALIAWERLTPEERAWVMERLELHPTKAELYEPAFKEEFANAEVSTEMRQRWFFGQTAVWCDLIRRRDGYPNAAEINPKYHRGEWHYTDLPVFPNAQAKAQMKAVDIEPVMDWKPGMQAPHEGFNSMHTLQRVVHELSDPKSDKAGAAVNLCWLFHLVGDTHQPCHCAQLFVPGKLESGDRGGNSIHVFGFKNSNPGLENDVLHSFWDSLMNGSKNGITDIAERISPLKQEPQLWAQAEKLAPITDPRQWLREGHALAVSAVYSPALLARLAAVEPVNNPGPGKSDKVMMISMPSGALESYISDARKVARQQVVTAGVRLAEAIKHCVKASSK